MWDMLKQVVNAVGGNVGTCYPAEWEGMFNVVDVFAFNLLKTFLAVVALVALSF